MGRSISMEKKCQRVPRWLFTSMVEVMGTFNGTWTENAAEIGATVSLAQTRQITPGESSSTF